MAQNTPAVARRLDELESLRSSLEEKMGQPDRVALFVESQTRDFVAKTVVLAFFILLATIVVGTPLYNAFIEADKKLDLANLLQQYASILGPILGFVIGYYFKAKE